MSCSFETCNRNVYAFDLCNGHYQQNRKGINLKPLRHRHGATDACSFSGCQKDPKAHGYCSGHYAQKRAGRPMTELKKSAKRVGKWDSKKILDSAIQVGDCLLFKAEWTQKYPRVRVGEQEYSAHRVVFEDFNGPVPPGCTIHHTCANTKCVNPLHLQRAHRADNTLEMLARKDYEAEIARLQLRIVELEAQLEGANLG
jgi:hypothetical protein